MHENDYRYKIAKACKELFNIQYIHTDPSSNMSGGKKPFDGIFIDQFGFSLAVEFKVDYSKLKNHQKLCLENFNGVSILLRIFKTKREYTIEIMKKLSSYTVTSIISYKHIAVNINHIFTHYHKHMKGN